MRNAFVRTWIPAGLRDAANKALGATIAYDGPHADWESAKRATDGYEAGAILRRVEDATRQVLDGQADYEQDGAAMSGTPAPGHALAALLLAASNDGGRLSVLDFGGGLGSHFLRWRAWLERVPELRWTVVEQAHYVAAGRRMLAGLPAISFAEDIPSAAEHRPNVVLASSVLQYLPDPLDTLDRLLELDPRIVVIDRTPLLDAGAELILTQRVPRQLGRASYPIRLLPRQALEDRLRQRYALVTQFVSDDAPIRIGGAVVHYAGAAWMRRG